MKMEKLTDIVAYYKEHSEKWNYYNMQFNKDDNNEIGLDDKSSVLQCDEKARRFIQEYFIHGRKLGIFYEDELNKIPGNRFTHTVSVFFLGLKIAECLGVDTAVRDSENMSFQYLWFLACLYHDIGYCYEMNKEPVELKMVRSRGIYALKSICGIDYIDNEEFNTYAKEVVNLYLKGRANKKYIVGPKESEVIDHGIAGGLMLYDRLRKNYDNHKKNHEKAFLIDDDDDSWWFSAKHFRYYAKAADAIISHNIWVDTIKRYPGGANFDLAKISSANLICYILCIADTLEPLKRTEDSIHDVSFAFSDGKITVLSLTKTYGEGYKNIKGMEEWIDVEVSVSDKGASIEMKAVQAE